MKARWIVNLLLLFAIVVLGLVAHFKPGINAPHRPTAITALQQSAVHRIHINRPLRDDLVLLRRPDGEWMLDRHSPLPADRFKVKMLTRLVEQPAVRSYPATGMNLAALQLAPPYATAIFNNTAVEFGNLEPIDDLRNVRVGKQVHLIPDHYLQLMEVSFTQFVRRRLFDKGARITALHLPGLSLKRSGKSWQAEPPQNVSTEAIQAFIETWQEASGLNVQATDPGKTGEPVTLQLEGRDTPIRLQIIRRQPELVLARPDYGIQYVMGNRGKALLNLSPTADVAAEK